MPRQTGKKPSKAVFLDRDGTVIHDRPGHYLSDPKDLKIYKASFGALKLLHEAGFSLFIISNQSGIGRGYFSMQTARTINKKLTDALERHGAPVMEVAFCPHRPDDNCKCRKPLPLMGERLIKKYRLDRSSCFMVGDKFSDIKFGNNLGIKTVLVKTGHGTSQLAEKGRSGADFEARNLLQAARWIKNEKQD